MDYSQYIPNLSAFGSSINTTLLTNYTEGQKAALLKFATEPDEKTYLLFIVPGNAGGVQGFMPLNRSAGFIYINGQSTDQINQTIAHELGHGAFGLDHVGKAADNAATPTDNLMDYSNSTALDKPQWDKMHSEYRRITWFQDAEEGMARWYDNELIKQFLMKIRNSMNTDTEMSLEELYRPLIITNSSSPFTLGDHNYKSVAIELKTIKTTKINAKQIEYDLTDPNGINIGYTQFHFGYFIITVRNEDVKALKEFFLKPNLSVSLFVGGYDPTKLSSDDKITQTSGYWLGIDEMFKQQLKTNFAFYADGNKSITTSNHKDVPTFVMSMTSSLNVQSKYLTPTPQTSTVIKNECYLKPSCVKLNTTPNIGGFDERLRMGRIAGINLVTELKKLYLLNNDEIDIVCHSMGFAYAQGIIEVLDEAINSKDLPSLIFNGYYIIAPENAESGTVDPSKWKQICQYGSDEITYEKTEPWLLDGVAPQRPVDNIGDNRAFIPLTTPKGFLISHTISGYDWIFKIEPLKKGYVKPRN